MNILKLFRKEKAAPVSTGHPGIIQLFMQDQANFTKPFSQHPGVHAAIKAKARNIAQVPFRVYRRGADEPEKNGAIVQLFKGSRYTPSIEMWEGIVTELELYGQDFLIKSDETVGGIPAGFQHPLSFEMRPQIVNKELVAWVYKNEVIPLDRVIHFKYFNPYDTINGLAPLSALLIDAETDYNAIKYNSKYFSSGGSLGNVYSVDGKLNDIQFERMKQRLITNRQGVDNAHLDMILEEGTTVSNTQKSNKDIQFLEMRKFTLSEIAMVYGVPKEALQQYEDINYSTAETANRSFWEKTLIPLMEMISQTINFQFLDGLGYEGRFDYGTVSALSQPAVERAQAAKIYFSMGVPFNVINDRFNLGFPDIDNGDKPLGGMDRYNENAPVDQPLKSAPEEKHVIPNDEVVDAVHKAKWIELNNQVRPLIGKAAKALRGYFRGINSKLLKRLTGAKAYKQVGNYDDIDLVISNLTDDDKLEAIMRDVEKDSIVAGANTVQALSDFKVKEILARRLKDISQINETTNELLRDRLRKALDEGIAEGLTEAQRTQKLIEAAGDVGEFNLKRARTIARTETHAAFSAGRHESVAEDPPDRKRWIADYFSDSTRDTHRELHREAVPYGQKYSNGLMYPLDPDGDAAEVCNCRCIETYEWD